MSAITATNTARPGMLRIPIARGLLYVLVLSFPFFSIEPKIFRPDWWIGGALIAVFALNVLTGGRVRIDPIGYSVLGFNAAVILSTAVNFWSWEAAQWVEFLTLWLQLVFATLLYFALANLKLSVPQMRLLLKLWTGTAVVVAIYALYQALARKVGLPFAYVPYLHSEPSPWALEGGLGLAGYVRPSSVLREPAYLGAYLLAPLLVTAVLTRFRRDHVWLFKTREWNRASLLALLAGFVVSLALSGYITLLGVILTAALLSRPGRKLALGVIGIGVVAFILTATVSLAMDLRLISAILEKFRRAMSTVILAEEIEEISIPGTSEGVRFQGVVLALSTWVHHPITGIGLNQLQFVGKSYSPEMLLSHVVETGYIWNIWLEVLVQSGALGLLFYGLIWFQALKMMWVVFRKSGEPWRWLGFAFFFVLLGTIIGGFMGGPFTFPLYWFYLGVASIILQAWQREQYANLNALS